MSTTAPEWRITIAIAFPISARIPRLAHRSPTASSSRPGRTEFHGLLIIRRAPISFIQAGTNGIPRATYNPTRTDFAPRIGVAWRPMKTERWVVRAAYGVFYDVGIFNINVFPRFNPPFYDLSYYANSGTNVIQNILSQPATAIVEPNMIARNFRDAYMQQWNVDLQYEIKPYWMSIWHTWGPRARTWPTCAISIR